MRAGLATGLMVTVVGLASPLTGLYVPHLTASDAPRVIALSGRTDFSLTMADGAVLDARLYSPTTRKILGVAVFTHGFGGWKEAWLNHLRLFLEADWAVLAYDLRGHGRSSPGAVTYGLHEADDLAEVWRAARAIADNRPMIAYGVSLGASVTMMAAQRLGDCRALVLESPFADAHALAELRLPTLLRVPALAVARWGVGIDLSALRPSAVVPPPDVQRLVGWIADDPVIPPAQSRELASALGADTVILEHGEHLDLIVHEPWRERVRLVLRTVAKNPHPL